MGWEEEGPDRWGNSLFLLGREQHPCARLAQQELSLPSLSSSAAQGYDVLPDWAPPRVKRPQSSPVAGLIQEGEAPLAWTLMCCCALGWKFYHSGFFFFLTKHWERFVLKNML